MVGPLMESELFGHVKGAFTGAANTKIGLHRSGQRRHRLLRRDRRAALWTCRPNCCACCRRKNSGRWVRVTTRHSDFRIIAATNRDLAKEVEKGTFRRDLYFRLNVINIRLSPLRERKEDIPALINHFLSRVGGNYSVTAEALEVMLSYDWPGNVRELENCMQHMVAINSGPAAARRRSAFEPAESSDPEEVAVPDGRRRTTDSGPNAAIRNRSPTDLQSRHAASPRRTRPLPSFP